MKTRLLIIIGIILFVIGGIFPIFPPIRTDIVLGIDQFSDFPIGMWLQPILMGSGLCLVGIVIVLKFMARKNL